MDGGGNSFGKHDNGKLYRWGGIVVLVSDRHKWSSIKKWRQMISSKPADTCFCEMIGKCKTTTTRLKVDNRGSKDIHSTGGRLVGVKTSEEDDIGPSSLFKIYSFLVGATSHLQLICAKSTS